MSNMIQRLDKRITELNQLNIKIDEAISGQKTAGFKNDPKYLTELKADVEKQKALCEKERQILEDKKALLPDIKGDDKEKQQAAKFKMAALNSKMEKLVRRNPELHPNPKKLADPCVPCLKKKMDEQDPKKHFIKFDLKDGAGKHVPSVSFLVQLPDGNEKRMKSGSSTLDISNIEPGSCKVPLEWEDGMSVHNTIFPA